MNKLIPIGGMEKMLYFNSWDPKVKKPYVIRMKYYLDDDVDPELLKESVRTARKFFWPFRMSLVLHKGSFMYEEIANEPPVFPFENRTYTLGTEETNGYMYYLLYDENSFEFFYAHGLSDATILQVFSYFVVNYYFSLKYPDETSFDIEEAYKKLNVWDTHDPFDYLTGSKTRAPKNFFPKEGYTIPEGCDYSTNDVIWLEFPEDKAMEIIRSLGVTPAAFFTALFNRALRDVCGPGDLGIIAAVTMDIRRITGRNPLTAYSGTAVVTDPAANDDLSFRDHCSWFHKEIANQTNTEQQDKVILLSLYSAKVIDFKILPPAVRAGIIHRLHKLGNKITTYVATNTGKMPLPPDRVKFLDAIASGTDGMYMLIANFRDSMVVKMLSFPGEKKIIDRYIELLRDEGLEAKYYVKKYTEPTRLDISRLSRR